MLPSTGLVPDDILKGIESGAEQPRERMSKTEKKQSRLAAKALGILSSAMQDPDPDIRVLAAKQWGLIGNPSARAVLRKALTDNSPYVRIAAAESLYRIGGRSGVEVVEKILAKVPKLPEKKGNEQLDAMEEMRFIAINKVRVEAAKALGRMGESSSSEILNEALRGRIGAVADAAAVGLTLAGHSPGMQDFVDALRSPDPSVRVQAVRALGEARMAEQAERIAALAADKSAPVRAEVMKALGLIGSAAGVPALRKGLTDQNRLVRSRALESLGLIGDPAAVPLLKEAQRTADNVYIELLAVAAIERLGEDVEMQTAQRALSQPDADTRCLAVEVLEAAGGEAAIENLGLSLEDREKRVRVRAAAAVMKLFTLSRQHVRDASNKGKTP